MAAPTLAISPRLMPSAVPNHSDAPPQPARKPLSASVFGSVARFAAKAIGPAKRNQDASEKASSSTTSTTTDSEDTWTTDSEAGRTTDSEDDRHSATTQRNRTPLRTVLLKTLLFLAGLTTIWTSIASVYGLIFSVSSLLGSPTQPWERHVPVLITVLEIFIGLCFCSRVYSNWRGGIPGDDEPATRKHSFREAVQAAVVTFMCVLFAPKLAYAVVVLVGVGVAKACGAFDGP